MLIKQSVAIRLPKATQEILERQASRLLRLANKLPTDVHAFAHSLFAEYLLNERVARPPQVNAFPDHIKIAATFDIHPFTLNGSQGIKKSNASGSLLQIDDTQALLPLLFRDALANTLLTPVQIGKISFGCMQVDYFVHNSTDLTLLDPSDISEVAHQFLLTKLDVRNEPYFSAR